MLTRAARVEDVPAIRDAGARSWRDAYADHLSPEEIEQGLERWWSEPALRQEITGGRVMVAEDDGVIIGVASGEPHWALPDAWVVWKLYVVPGRRSAGVGGQLLTDYLGHIPATFTAVVLEHFAFNTRAGHFYDRQGFAVERSESDDGGDIVWRRLDR